MHDCLHTIKSISHTQCKAIYRRLVKSFYNHCKTVAGVFGNPTLLSIGNHVSASRGINGPVFFVFFLSSFQNNGLKESSLKMWTLYELQRKWLKLTVEWRVAVTHVSVFVLVSVCIEVCDIDPRERPVGAESLWFLHASHMSNSSSQCSCHVNSQHY